MSSTAVQYAGALRHTGCTLSDLQHTADYLTDCAPLWDALCSPAVCAREKKAVLSRLPDFDAMGELKHFYLLLADKNRFSLLPEIVRLPNCCAHDTVIVQLRLKSCRTTRCSAALLPKSTA